MESCSDKGVELDGSSTATKGGWKASLFIIWTEFSERIASLSILSNLITYLTNVMHQGLASSAKNVNNWLGVTTVLPLLGGFLADSYVGRYWMVVFSSAIYFLGLGLLTMVVSVPSLKPPPCPSNGALYCRNASSTEAGLLFFALYMISIGSGGHRPSLGSFGPDQFDEQNPKEKLQKQSFFNWLFFSFGCGFLMANTVVVYVQENVSWGAGFGLVTAVFGISIVVFLVGTPFYRHRTSSGSAVTRLLQVFVAAARNRHLNFPSDTAMLHEDWDIGVTHLQHTQSFRWLDKAATIRQAPTGFLQETKSNLWKLCTVTQVEEAKQIVRIVPIWFTCLTFAVVLPQQSTFFVKQSSTMERKFGSNFTLPQASVITFGIISYMLFIPLYDRVLVPVARRITGNERGITILQRIGVGLFFSILALSVAALVEVKRLKTARRSGLVETPHETLPLSVFWLFPQYMLLAISESFTLVGLQEYFYSEVPDNMKSMGIAMYLSVIGVGSFMSSLLITIVDKISKRVGSRWFVNNLNKCHLDYFFWVLAILSTINLCFFMYFALRYRYKRAMDAKNSRKSGQATKSGSETFEVEMDAVPDLSVQHV